MAGLTAIRLPGFALLVLVTRPWGLVFSALVGSGTLVVPVVGWVIIGLLSVALLYISVRYPDKLEEWMSDRILNLFKKKKRTQQKDLSDN